MNIPEVYDYLVRARGGFRAVLIRMSGTTRRASLSRVSDSLC